MVKYNFGGLLDKNIYLNNVAKKTGNPLIDGTVDINVPKIRPSSAYNNAVAKNNNALMDKNIGNNNPQDNIVYPPEVLQEPKRRNMLEEYLWGRLKPQASVEQKKLIYRFTMGMSDAQKIYFQQNPEEFAEMYLRKTEPDFFADETSSATATTAMQNMGHLNTLIKNRDAYPVDSETYKVYDSQVKHFEKILKIDEKEITEESSHFEDYGDMPQNMQTNALFNMMADPTSAFAKDQIANAGVDPKEFDRFATIHGTTPEDRTEGGITYSYQQWQFKTNTKNSAFQKNLMEFEKGMGATGNRTYQSATYNDDGSTTWSEPIPYFHNKVQMANDKDFGRTIYKDWNLAGGFRNELANIQNFGEVINILNDPNATSSGMAFEVTPTKLTKLIESGYEPTTNEETGKTYQINNVLDLVRAVVFQSLKKTLGGQFTEREAERLVEATFNPSLPPKVNMKRIIALRDKMIQTFKSQARAVEYYEKNNGTLYGYQSTIGSVNLAKLDETSISQFTNETVQEMFEQDRDFYESMSVDEANIHWESAGRLERAFMETIFE